MLNTLYQRASPVARRMLPKAMRARLGSLVGRLERLLSPLEETRSAPSIAGAIPLFPPSAFANGPILHINNALAWGGVERQIVNTLLGLQQSDPHPLGLLCLRLGEGGDYIFYRDALKAFRGEVRDIRALDSAQAFLRTALESDRLEATANLFAWMPSDVRERIWRLLGEFAELKPSVVHAWQDGLSIETAYAAKLAGVPTIITCARNMAPPNFAYGRPYMRPAYRALAACDDVVMLANSEAGARSYAQWLGIGSDRFRVLRNGVRTSDVQPLSPASQLERRRALGIPDDAPIVGSVFRFYEEKRPLLWMQAAALIARQNPHVHFVVFGDGPLRADARNFAARHAFADRLHTPGAATDGASAISMFDVFLLTSRFEGTPNVVLEAGALGVPVVATPAGGTGEAIDLGETGWLETDAPALARRVLLLLTDAGLRANCATRGPAFVAERFGLERMIAETRALYPQSSNACST